MPWTLWQRKVNRYVRSAAAAARKMFSAYWTRCCLLGVWVRSPSFPAAQAHMHVTRRAPSPDSWGRPCVSLTKVAWAASRQPSRGLILLRRLCKTIMAQTATPACSSVVNPVPVRLRRCRLPEMKMVDLGNRRCQSGPALMDAVGAAARDPKK